jgi:hypothetical protein
MEEGSDATTSPTSPTPTNGPGFDTLLLALALPIGASIVVVLAFVIKRRT